MLFAKLHIIHLPSQNPSAGGIPGVSDKPLREAIPIVSQHGGLVSQIDNSSLIATFGISPQRLPSRVSAFLATHAGLAISDYVAKLNKSRSAYGLPTLNLSIGIATGYVTAQEKIRPGDGTSTLVGNVMKTAKRLQQFTFSVNSAGILISEETYQNLSGTRTHFTFGRQGPAKFPWEKKKKMVYEVGGRTVRLVDDPHSHEISRRVKPEFQRTIS
jgi:class 3 adenylate cyclase